MLQQPDRFAPLGNIGPINDTSASRLIDPSKQYTPALTWASRYNRKWFKALRQRDHSQALHCILLQSNVAHVPVAWVLVMTHNRTGHSATCHVIPSGDGFML